MPSVATQQKAVSANPVRNNGLTIVNAGNVPSTSPVTNSMGYVKVLAFHPASNGSRIPHAATTNGGHLNVDNTGVPTAAAISGGDYGIMTAGRYIIRRYTQFIAGVASSIFNSGCSDYPSRRSINYQIYGRATQLYGWSITGGSGAHPGGTSTVTYSYTRMNNIWINDKVTTPTRAVPGDLVYRTSSNNYTVGTYSAKNT